MVFFLTTNFCGMIKLGQAALSGANTYQKSAAKNKKIIHQQKNFNNMGGLRRICKAYGGMTFTDAKGVKTEYIWDYIKDEPRRKEEFTDEEWAANERFKWGGFKAALKGKKPPPKKKFGDSEQSTLF
jgi:hypothetical protein